MGLVEGVQVTMCNIQFNHTFVVVDFKQETNYEVILGRTFMCQMLVVQDWGYNHVYFFHGNNNIRINLDNHSYRDVTKTPIEDVDTTSYDPIWEITSEETQEEGAWLCDIYKRESMQEEIIRAE